MSTNKENLMLQLLNNAVDEVEMLDSSDSEVDEIMGDVTENISAISSLRYYYRTDVPKNLSWFEETLQQYDEKRFKVLMRCTRKQFQVILDLIKDNEVFHGKNSEKQFSPYLQLALVMYRLGSKGSGSSIGKIAPLFGIGDGGTIDKITWRIFKCILALESEFLKWPSVDERADITFETCDKLPHCVGYLDGTEIPLEYTPYDDHVSYWSRKKKYSIKMQAVCDYRLILRHVVIGWPGSVHDARIFEQSRLSTNPDEFFAGVEYLAADSAYTLKTTVMTPFRSNSTNLTHAQRCKFNKYFSSERVKIEHLFGILKQIFFSLKSLSIHVSKKSHEFACTWVRVCCILYNILRPHLEKDELQAYLRQIPHLEDEDEEGLLVDPDDLAEAKRIALYGIIFNENV